MSFEWFRPQDIIILLAVGLIGGLIVAANLSVRSKRGEATAGRDHEDGE